MVEAKANENTSVMYPSSDNGRALASIASLLKDIPEMLPLLRQEFRGEVTVQYEDGTVERVQQTKPMFVKIDFTTNKPIKVEATYKSGKKMIYVPNDEAIEEVLSMAKSMGLNRLTPITNLSENNVLDDLLEFECKLAGVLGLKQKEWGLDKTLMPMIMTKIKTLIQDARYMSVKGGTLKAIQKTVQRIEQSTEGDKKGRLLGPYA